MIKLQLELDIDLYLTWNIMMKHKLDQWKSAIMLHIISHAQV